MATTKARIIYEAVVAQAIKGQAALRAEVLAGTKTVNQAAKEWNKYNLAQKNAGKVLNQSSGAMSKF
ncbi:hypothetical protein LCGC14_1034030, partial [marine sediment metagenome]